MDVGSGGPVLTLQSQNHRLGWGICMLAHLVMILLQMRAVEATYVNNLLKNYDTQEYVWLDCNGPFFDTLIYTNENMTIYANLCRMLPAHIYKLEDLPATLEIPEANIFIKRRVSKSYRYTFLNLNSNNGVSTPTYPHGPGAEYFWRLDDPALDLSLKVYPGEQTLSKSGIDFMATDEFKLGPNGKLNAVFETNMKISYNYSVAATRPNSVSTTLIGFNGIFRQSEVTICIRVTILLSVMFIVGIPFQRSIIKSRYSLFTWSLYFLSLNYATEVSIQYFGERVPTTNLLLWFLLPALGATLMQSRKLSDRVDTRTNARWLFYFCAVLNYLLFSIFVVSMNHKNKSTFSGVFVGLFLPVAVYLVLFFLSQKPFRLSYMTLRYFIGVFIACRLFQIMQSPKGCMKRIFGDPLLGKHYDNLQAYIWVVPILGAAYSYIFYTIVAKSRGAEEEYSFLKHGANAAANGSYMAETDEIQNNSETKF